MSRPSRPLAPPLKLVTSDEGADRAIDEPTPEAPAIADVDWAILMARAQDGDAHAYRRLLDEITPYLRFLAARRHRDPGDREDAVQDILLTVHAARRTYDPARPFGPWLITIAQRRLVDRLRRQGRSTAHETSLCAEHDEVADVRVNMEAQISDRRELEAALARLPPRQRQAIQVLKIEELSLNEAARATGLSVAALKVSVHRALASLRKILSNHSHDT